MANSSKRHDTDGRVPPYPRRISPRYQGKALKLPNIVNWGARILVLFLLLPLAACSVYKLSMRQGNILDKKALNPLHDGMTKQQVEQILGTPLVTNPFRPNRWDYIFYFQAPGENPVQHTVSITFSNDVVASIQQSGDLNAGNKIRPEEKFLRESEPNATPTPNQTAAPPSAPGPQPSEPGSS